MAGAMSTAEIGISLAEMIRRDKIHAVSCTGANLEEDLYNLVAHDYYKRIPQKYHIFVALILGGTIGNLIDRLFRGFVVDFIDFSFWPAFNIADMAISIGAIFLIILLIKDKEDKQIHIKPKKRKKFKKIDTSKRRKVF